MSTEKNWRTKVDTNQDGQIAKNVAAGERRLREQLEATKRQSAAQDALRAKRDQARKA